jgi:tRNA (guanine37-N1)-methyltransferase
MLVDVVSIFPDLFAPVLSVGMTGRAIGRGVVEMFYTDPRTFTKDKHQTVDDTPYGGGSGMVMRVEPLVHSLQAVEQTRGRGHRILLTPTGAALTQATVRRLAALPHLVLVCGRYEGVDDRISNYIDEEISIGDFILSGGELGALIIIDAVARLCPGVLHNHLSIEEESFEHGLLEYPQYTRPATYEGAAVPEILLSGDHEKVRIWRRQQSLVRTRVRRPDLFARHVLSKEDTALLARWDASVAVPSAPVPAATAVAEGVTP